MAADDFEIRITGDANVEPARQKFEKLRTEQKAKKIRIEAEVANVREIQETIRRLQSARVPRGRREAVQREITELRRPETAGKLQFLAKQTGRPLKAILDRLGNEILTGTASLSKFIDMAIDRITGVTTGIQQIPRTALRGGEGGRARTETELAARQARLRVGTRGMGRARGISQTDLEASYYWPSHRRKKGWYRSSHQESCC